MGHLRRNLTAGLASVIALTAGHALAQSSPALDRLISASLETYPERAINPDARASERYAIVIGNKSYKSIPELRNAQNDAALTAEFLRSQGYDTRVHYDLTKRGFEDVLRRVLFDVDQDTEVVVFFAGHGFQIGADNYLVPVDADLDEIYDVPFEAVSLGSLVSIVGARARLQVVILDSCRDNPFAGKELLTLPGTELRAAKTGFASQSAPLNSMLIYSTSPGSIAFDGDGDNSPFTAALVQEASKEPDRLVKSVFEDVRRTVFDLTNGRQVPWDSSTLIEQASFGAGAAMSRPIDVSLQGGGESRGVARISSGAGATTQSDSNVQLAADVSQLIEADFLPEVDIGFTLRNALDLTPADQVTIVKGTETGRLVLADASGTRQNVEGQTLTSAQIDELVLANDSVQIPALTLENGQITDSIELSVNGEAQTISLTLTPDACDFQAGALLDPDGMGITRYPNELEPEAALAACEASVAREPNVGRYHYQLGRALTALKRFEEAEVAYERARDLGHSRAWLALGGAIQARQLATGGEGELKASDEVQQLYARGVKEGDPYAFYALGREFMLYGGTPELEIEGYDLMMRALEVGHTFAMNELGYFYLNPDNEYADAERGLRYLRESAARGDIYGFNNMGIVFSEGLGGTEVDNQAAFEMYTKAAEGGHPSAPTNLAWMYLDGLVTGREDKVKAVEWFDEGLNRGQAAAGRYAARLIYDEGVDGYDRFDAAVYGAKAAALSNQSAAERARELIESFNNNALGGGAQTLINDLGGSVTVDGAFGPASRAAMQEVLDAHGAGGVKDTPVERIIQLAEIVWTKSKFRVDLY